MNCLGGACPAVSDAALKNALGDLCWALLENVLDEADNASKWKPLFRRLSQAGDAVHGDCSCCMEERSAAKAQCRWTWRDKCSRIPLLNAINP